MKPPNRVVWVLTTLILPGLMASTFNIIADNDSTTTEPEKVWPTTPDDCLETGRLLFNGHCYQPLSDDPCNFTSERFVMNDTGEGVCIDLTCREDRDNKLDERQVMFRGRCEELGDSRVCGQPGRKLMLNVKGEGECVCSGGWVEGPDGNCHLLFTSGYCNQAENELLVPIMALRHSSPLKDEDYGCGAGEPCLFEMDQNCKNMKHFESFLYGMNNSPLPGSCRKKGSDGYCCQQQTIVDRKYYMTRMMEVSKGFGRCIKNHCDNPRRQTVYPRDEKSTQCLPVQGDLSACETELFISAGNVKCKKDTDIELGFRKIVRCNQKNVLREPQGACINQLAIPEVSTEMKETCLMSLTAAFLEDGQCHDFWNLTDTSQNYPCEVGFDYVISESGSGFCRLPPLPRPQKCRGLMKLSPNNQGDLTCVCEFEETTMLNNVCHAFGRESSVCTKPKQRLVKGSEAVESGLPFQCSMNYTCSKRCSGMGDYKRLEAKLDGIETTNKTTTVTNKCRVKRQNGDVIMGVCCPDISYKRDFAKFILSRIEARSEDPGVCVDTECMRGRSFTLDLPSPHCSNTAEDPNLTTAFKTGTSKRCRNGLVFTHKGCRRGFGRG